MSKSAEFEKLFPEDRRQWCTDNYDLILRALKTQEAFDRGESDADHAGYYSHERDYAARELAPVYTNDKRRRDIFKRGFFEGWKAARRFVIQDPK